MRNFISLRSMIVLAALYAMASGLMSEASEHSRSYIPIQVLSHIDITDKDIERVERGVSTIPAQIQKVIAGAGIELVLTPQMNFAEPESSGKKVFRNGGTAENLGGVFESGKHRVVIPEKASWRNSTPRPQGNYIISICRHELGHAYDFSLNGHSHTQSYMQAYDEDFKKLTNEQCRKWAYYITGTSNGDANVPTASGRAECFASIFAALVTPQSELNPKAIDLLQTFAHVAKNVSRLDDDLGHVQDPNPQKNPTKTPLQKESAPSSPAETAESTMHIETAKKLLAERKFQQAVYQLNWAIKLNSANSEAFILRGNAYCWMTKYKLAVKDYTKAIELNPARKDAYEMRARAHGWLGEARLQKEDEARSKNP